MGYNKEEGAASFLGSVPEGAIVRVSMANSDQILQGTEAALQEAIATYPAGSKPEGVLVASCLTRSFLLGSRADNEYEKIQAAVGGVSPRTGPTRPGSLHFRRSGTQGDRLQLGALSINMVSYRNFFRSSPGSHSLKRNSP